MPTAAKVKGRYELEEVIAKGGMGVVYRAIDTVMKRAVAVKTLLDITDDLSLQLFQRECEVLASMIHPNIVEIYDVGQIEEQGVLRPYLVMPLLPGLTLDKLIRSSSQRLTIERSIDIIGQACRGLQAAHERGLVHRDIKPSNLFILEDDSVKIIDFGVAHRMEASRTVGRKGTLLYMAPEQIEMKPVSAVTDVFSLGVVCYETLTRRRPFERATESSVAEAILRFVPAPAFELNPAVNRAVSQAIHKAMAKQPWHRYSTAREFGETLVKALRGEPIEMFDSARIRPRIQRAQETFGRGDYQFASEVVGELEAEGHLDSTITELRGKIEAAIRRKTVEQLLETAQSRIEAEEYPLALQKIYEVLQLDPLHAQALALKSSVENRRTERDMEQWFRLAQDHLQRLAFQHARDALQRILQLRPTDTRAVNLLKEVDRTEHEHTRARQEKEQLYQAALAHEQKGEISSALSELERVLELDRRIPDTAAPERATAYQNLYNRVRSEHERIQSAYAAARQKMESGDFPAALAISAEQLEKYPGHALFQALKIDVEEKRRQAISARVAETDRQVEAEPDLDRRLAIVEDAARANPGEEHFSRLLERTREKRQLIEGIVARARALEQQGQFSEALSQWEILKTIYPRYPGLSMEIDRVSRRREQQIRADAKSRWVEQIDRQLEAREYARALELLEMAQQEHPGDAELAQLEKAARRGLEIAAELAPLFEQGRQAFEARRYAEAIPPLQRAWQLDERHSGVRAALLEALIARARDLVESDPDSAERFARRVLDMDPANGLGKGLLSVIEDRRRREALDRCLAEIRRLQVEGDLAGTLEAIERALEQYPAETRLVQLRASLTKAPQKEQPQATESSMPQEAAPPVILPTEPTAATRVHSQKQVWQSGLFWKIAIVAAALLAIMGFAVAKRTHPAQPREAAVSFRILTDPAGASVTLDENPVGNTPLPLTILPGTHAFRFSLPGYQDAQHTWQIGPGFSLPAPERLAPLPARLEVSSESPKATVLLDGESKSAPAPGMPLEISGLALDTEHKLQFAVGNASAEISFQAHAAQNPQFAVTPAKPGAPAFLLLSTFQGKGRLYSSAKIQLSLDGGNSFHDAGPDGIDLDQLPTDGVLTLQDASGVIRTLVASRENAPTLHVVFFVSKPPAPLGSIAFDSLESDFAVLIDGKRVPFVRRGQSYAVYNLAEGNREVKLHKDGFRTEPESISVNVKANVSTPVSFRWVVLPTLLVVQGAIPGTRVSIGGRVLTADSNGELRLEVQPGTNSVTLSKDGYKLRTLNSIVALGSSWLVPRSQAHLEPISGTFLFAKRDPARGVRLTIQQIRGVPLEVPINYEEAPDSVVLPVGSYNLTFEAPGYKPETVTAGLAESEKLQMDINLQRR
jgi:serine/threonine protein kinase